MDDDEQMATSWGPMAEAMRKATRRKIAIAGGREVGAMQSNDDDEADCMLRMLLSGTGVPVEAMRAASLALGAYVPSGIAAGASLEHIVNGIVCDAFVLGFWTHEAMP